MAEGLKQGGRGGSAAGRGWRNALAVAEVGVAVVLVIGAGLMLRSFALLNSADTGFRPDHVLTARMMLVFNKYARDLPRRAGVVEETLERIRALPQVISASSIHILPMLGTNSGTGYYRADRPAPEPGSGTGGEVSVVSDRYFRTMGIPMLEGREFDRSRDRMGGPGVAILNRAGARTLFPGEDAIGKRLQGFLVAAPRSWRSSEWLRTCGTTSSRWNPSPPCSFVICRRRVFTPRWLCARAGSRWRRPRRSRKQCGRPIPTRGSARCRPCSR